MARETTQLKQCSACGYLQGGGVPDPGCPGGKHKFRALDPKLLASTLGKRGGRPRKYETDEERQAARRATFQKANAKRRGKEVVA